MILDGRFKWAVRPVLWGLLTHNVKESNNSDQTDNDDYIDGNDKFKEREFKEFFSPFPAVMYDINVPNIFSSEIVNIAPREIQIPVCFTLEPNWEALAFPKDYSIGRNHFNEERKIPITRSKYVHARLKCCDDRFAANPQYIFHAFDWIERNAFANSVYFAGRKLNVAKLVNHDNVRRMIYDEPIFSPFKSIRGTSQYFNNILLDVLGKTRQFGV